ncbi:MAG: monovalent cation/H+ antiporter complex subunit F [Desulfuromonadales bacterium]|nr:monovalent cation/H+ antiporter complex subunit F [Desulfuromonadales bacterium]
MMSQVFLAIALALVMLIFLTLVRALGGPTVLDRIVGVNMIGTKTTVLLLLIGLIYEDMPMFIDIALAYAFLNFIATIGACKYFRRSKRVHLEDDLDTKKEVSA